MDKDKETFESKAPICKKCGAKTYLTSFYYIRNSRQRIKRKYSRGNRRLIYICPICHSYVNVHRNTNEPLGYPGDKELRLWRKFTHNVFDSLWHKTGNRQKAYTWLARKLKIEQTKCHIGMFDSNLCKKTIELCLKEMARKPR